MKITLADLLIAAKGDTSLAISILEAPTRPEPGCFNPTTGYWRCLISDDKYDLCISQRPQDEGVRMTEWERAHG